MDSVDAARIHLLNIRCAYSSLKLQLSHLFVAFVCNFELLVFGRGRSRVCVYYSNPTKNSIVSVAPNTRITSVFVTKKYWSENSVSRVWICGSSYRWISLSGDCARAMLNHYIASPYGNYCCIFSRSRIIFSLREWTRSFFWSQKAKYTEQKRNLTTKKSINWDVSQWIANSIRYPSFSKRK